MSTSLTAIDAIERHLGPLSGKHLLDVGCGSGALRMKIENLGASWTGLEPFSDGADKGIIKAPAQEMPFPDARFDGVIFVNSLHHVPTEQMKAALSEAARVLSDHGRIVVIEPEIEGALSEVVAVVDDEAQIRTNAQTALDDVIRDGLLSEAATQRYVRTERYRSFDEFCQKISTVSPERADLISRRADALKHAFEVRAIVGGAAWLLTQPMLVRVLERSRPR